MTVDEFVRLCTQLKALGAAKVSADGWEAVFPVSVSSLANPTNEKPKPVARGGVDKFKSEDELREEQYARELGRR